MGVKSSPYNNPQIGAALESVAQLFAPMKATDAYAYAHANSERGKAARLAEAYRMITAPGATRAVQDAYGVGAGLYNPDQGYGVAQDKINALITNNNADNARALQQTRMQEEGANYRKTLEPVTVGRDATAFIPQPMQQATGLAPVLAGQTSLQPGEIAISATGQRMEGAPPAMTLDQLKAREAGALRAAGKISDQQIIDATMGPGELEKVVGPNGPVLMTRGQAVGQQPYVRPTDTHIAGNYRTPSGAQGVAVIGPNGRLADSQTGEELPAGVQTFRSQAQGSADDVVNKTTAGASQRRLQQFDRLIATADQLEKTISQGAGNQGLVGAVRGTAQDAVAALNEIGRAIGIDPQQMQQIQSDALNGRLDPTLAQQILNRDGTIAPVKFLTHILANQAADVLASGDRTSNMELQSMISALGQEGVLSNPLHTQEVLRTLRAWVANQRQVDMPAAGAGFNNAYAGRAPAAPATGGYKILNVR